MEFQMSWSTYLIAWFITAAGYYSIFLFRFYKHRLYNSEKKKPFSPKPDGSIFTQSHTESNDPRSQKTQDELIHLVHDQVDQIQALLKQLSLQSSDKETLIRSVSLLLKKYPLLGSSTYRQPLTNLIATESENQCKIQLSEEELTTLWDFSTENKLLYP